MSFRLPIRFDKLLRVSGCSLCAFIAFSFSAQAKEPLTQETEDRLVSVCKALKSDSSIKLNRALKRSRTSHHDVAKGLVCNGMNSLAFAIQHKAYHNASYLAEKADVIDPLQTAEKKVEKKEKPY